METHEIKDFSVNEFLKYLPKECKFSDNMNEIKMPNIISQNVDIQLDYMRTTGGEFIQIQSSFAVQLLVYWLYEFLGYSLRYEDISMSIEPLDSSFYKKNIIDNEEDGIKIVYKYFNGCQYFKTLNLGDSYIGENCININGYNFVYMRKEYGSSDAYFTIKTDEEIQHSLLNSGIKHFQTLSKQQQKYAISKGDHFKMGSIDVIPLTLKKLSLRE